MTQPTKSEDKRPIPTRQPSTMTLLQAEKRRSQEIQNENDELVARLGDQSARILALNKIIKDFDLHARKNHTQWRDIIASMRQDVRRAWKHELNLKKPSDIMRGAPQREVKTDAE